MEQSKKNKRRPLKGVTPALSYEVKHSSHVREEEAEQKPLTSKFVQKQEVGFLKVTPDANSLTKHTYQITQGDLKKHVDLQTSTKIFDLHLTQFGGYYFDWSRNGRWLLLGGQRGHLALLDAESKAMSTELHLESQIVRDVKILHNETMFAVAQAKYVHIYDQKGTEVHCLKKHISPNAAGTICYQDISTGEIVQAVKDQVYEGFSAASHDPSAAISTTSISNNSSTRIPFRSNPATGVITVGQANGTVSMWSPAVKKPLLTMRCHNAPLTALAFERSGHCMVTSSTDGSVKVWDIRNNYRKLFSYYVRQPAFTLDISDRGLLAVGVGNGVSVWKDALHGRAQYTGDEGDSRKQRERQERMVPQQPYMRHTVTAHNKGNPTSVVMDLHFRPFEDVLGVGHSYGWSSIVVPGSGESRLDTFENNPYQNVRQRQEQEVRQLLEKLPADMITLNPSFVGRVLDTPAASNDNSKKSSSHNNSSSAGKQKKKNKGSSNNNNNNNNNKKRRLSEEESKTLQKQKFQKIQRSRFGKDAETIPGALSRFAPKPSNNQKQ